MKTALTLISDERDIHTGDRYKHSWDDDDQLINGELRDKAVAHLQEADISNLPEYGRSLIKAASLIVAELDRIQRSGTRIVTPRPAVETQTNDGPSNGDLTKSEINDGVNTGKTIAEVKGVDTGAGAEVETEDDDEVEGEGEETVDDLVENNTREELLELAEKEGVEASGTKTEIAEAICAKRRGPDTVEYLVENKSREELLQLADDEEVEVHQSANKTEIAEAIIAAREAKTEA